MYQSDSAPTQKPATVLLARHATPDWSLRSIRYDIPPGPPLTAQGEQEAAQLGAYMREQGVRKVYASPLVRTLRTAEIGAGVAGAALAVAPELAEWRRDEDEAQVLARVHQFWLRAAVESRTRGPVALVTHGGCVLAMLNWLGVPAHELQHYRNQFDHANPIPPAGAWLTREEPAGVPGLDDVRSALPAVAAWRDDGEHGAAGAAPLAAHWQVGLRFSPTALKPFQQAMSFV